MFLGDIQRHRYFTTGASSRVSSPRSTPTSSPPNTASLPGVFAFNHLHGRRSTRSSLDDDIDIDMDPPAVSAAAAPNAPTATSAFLHDGDSIKPGKVDPMLALELRLRWLEALVWGIKQDSGRERRGKGKDAAEYASFGSAQGANLKRRETLMRHAQGVQQRLDKALEGNEGLKRFMDNCLYFLLCFWVNLMFFLFFFSSR